MSTVARARGTNPGCRAPRATQNHYHQYIAREKPMIYELRIYRAVPGKLPALISRFQHRTLRIWEKHGIRQAGFWTTMVGDSMQELTYMLAWENLGEREKRWSAFLADPEWIAAAAESEKDGQILEDVRNALLAPTAFSAVK